MRPVAFNSFKCTPRLPAGWDKMALRNVHAFGNVFEIEVSRPTAGKLVIAINKSGQIKKYTIKEGATQMIIL